MISDAPGGNPAEHPCSAKGCQQPARWALVWNNPKLHTPDREKRWAACAEHLEYLRGFLDTRGFLRRVDPVSAETAWDS